jgi:hypothetical protein
MQRQHVGYPHETGRWCGHGAQQCCAPTKKGAGQDARICSAFVYEILDPAVMRNCLADDGTRAW